MNATFTKITIVRLCALLLAPVSGYLLSKASLIGRTGINLFYKEYKFLKTGWQGTLLILAVFLILWALHHFIQRRAGGGSRVALHLLIALISIAGLVLTYQDFRHTLSHRLLGERFHLGAYLFWVGWLIISSSFLLEGKKRA